MKFPQLQIEHMIPRVPILQGGMGVGISLSGLSAAVANAGGIGIISGTGISIEEMRTHIRRVRVLTKGKGYVGVNVLFAMKDFAEKNEGCYRRKGRFHYFWSGYFKRYVCLGEKNAGVPVISIVSSAKLAKISERLGAAAVVVEGCEAGGHIGTDRPLFDILPEVVRAVKNSCDCSWWYF
ncbi:hypothetical protein GCM10020331_070920 [Ectobacillus funiculus]